MVSRMLATRMREVRGDKSPTGHIAPNQFQRELLNVKLDAVVVAVVVAVGIRCRTRLHPTRELHHRTLRHRRREPHVAADHRMIPTCVVPPRMVALA